MKTKKEVIQSAWAENWDLLFYSEREHALQNNGWIPNTGLKLINKITFDFKEMHITYGSPEQWIRPKSIAGIETNNGWIRIESEADLPKEDIDCFYIPKRSGKIVVGCFRLVSYKGWKKMFTVDHNIAVGFGHVTHYQPIIKPLAPIY